MPEGLPTHARQIAHGISDSRGTIYGLQTVLNTTRISNGFQTVFIRVLGRIPYAFWIPDKFQPDFTRCWIPDKNTYKLQTDVTRIPDGLLTDSTQTLDSRRTPTFQTDSIRIADGCAVPDRAPTDYR